MKILEDKNRILRREIRDMNQRLKRMKEVLSQGKGSSPSVEVRLNSIETSLENLEYKRDLKEELCEIRKKLF